ncbi:unnamed protein product, partial [Didymodactylos carnosus]
RNDLFAKLNYDITVYSKRLSQWHSIKHHLTHNYQQSLSSIDCTISAESHTTIEENIKVILFNEDRISELADALTFQLEYKNIDLTTFDNIDQLIAFVSNQKDRLFLVTSSFNLIPVVHSLFQIQFIYSFTSDYDNSEQKQLSIKYEKVRGSFNEIKALIQKLNVDITQQLNNLFEIPSIFVYKKLDLEEISLKNLNERQISFVWSQLLIKILLQLPETEGHADDYMRTVSHVQYKYIELIPKRIDILDTNYSSQEAIWWYIFDSFRFRLINKAFRIENMDRILKFRYFLTDVHNHLRQLQCTSSSSNKTNFIVYRGQLMSPDELHMIKDSIDGFITMNTFLLTTKSYDTARIFAENSSDCLDYESVLFEITIDTNVFVTPYATINTIKDCQDKDVIMFSLGTVFRIRSVELFMSKIWYIRLIYTKEENDELQSLNERFQNEIGAPLTILTFGNYLSALGKHSEAEIYYTELLRNDPSNSTILTNLGNMKENHLEAEKYYQLARENVGSDGNSGVLTCATTSQSVCSKGQIQFCPLDDDDPSAVYNNIASIYYSEGKYDSALDYYKKALEITLKSFPNNHNYVLMYEDMIATIMIQQRDTTKSQCATMWTLGEKMK